MANKEPTEGVKKAAAPPVYTAAELINASRKVFGVSPDITTAALRMAGIKQATIEEAKEIVKKFATKEVK